MGCHTRRAFIRRVTGGVVASTAFSPALLHSSSAPGSQPTRLLPPGDGGPVDEDFWRVVKAQFPLRADLTIMNAANLCPSPYPVIEAVTALTRDVDSDASFQNRAKFAALRERARELLAAYLRADVGEIAITRNTSEGNNTVINGLSLGRGDEVVIWDQNHPTNNVAWDVRAERYGYAVRRISTPAAPQSDDDLIAPFLEAITPHTKVIGFSHVSNVSGVALPAKQLCAIARDRGVVTLVDGAQTFGALHVDLHDLGCDYYTGSSHKWLMGPKEAGVLYVRAERIGELWPSDVGVGWSDALSHGAQKFENLGQRDDAAVAAMGQAVEFHNTVGPDLIEERVRSLAQSLKDGLRERLPGARFHTPLSSRHSAGVVVFTLPGVDTRALYTRLYAEHDIAAAAMSGEFAGLRFSPHVYNTMEDVNRVFDVLGQL